MEPLGLLTVAIGKCNCLLLNMCKDKVGSMDFCKANVQIIAIDGAIKHVFPTCSQPC